MGGNLLNKRRTIVSIQNENDARKFCVRKKGYQEELYQIFGLRDGSWIVPVRERLARAAEVVELPVSHALNDEVLHEAVYLVPGLLPLHGVPLPGHQPVLVLRRQLPHAVLVHGLRGAERSVLHCLLLSLGRGPVTKRIVCRRCKFNCFTLVSYYQSIFSQPKYCLCCGAV